MPSTITNSFTLLQIGIFYLSWTWHMLKGPIVLVSLLCIVAKPASAYRKLSLVLTALKFLCFSKDKKWKHPAIDYPGIAKSKSKNTTTTTTTTTTKTISKTIVFIRHGESTWNDCFNKGSGRSTLKFLLYFIPNLIYAGLLEFYFFVSGQDTESWFYDSPLSAKGVNQSLQLRDFLKSQMSQESMKDYELMNRLFNLQKSATITSSSSTSTTTNPNNETKIMTNHLIISSNLRRAITTLAIALQPQFEIQSPKVVNTSISSSSPTSSSTPSVLISTDLQEASFNPDALSITPANQYVQPTFADRLFITSSTLYSYLTYFYSTKLNIENKEFTRGNKEFSSNGYKRMMNFNKLLFANHKNDDNNDDVVIACGHSLWFKSFFKTFIPYQEDHIAKKKKIVNCGVVSFTLNFVVDDTSKDVGNNYWIDTESIRVLYGGFSK